MTEALRLRLWTQQSSSSSSSVHGASATSAHSRWSCAGGGAGGGGLGGGLGECLCRSSLPRGGGGLVLSIGGRGLGGGGLGVGGSIYLSTVSKIA